jgi:ADP-heptose:LPS heptosyltransferase
MNSYEAPILILHQGALGDLLLSLPALYSLRVYHKNNLWTLVGNTANLVLLHHRFYAQALRSHHEKEWAYLYQEQPILPDPFRAFLRRFERVYVFASHPPELLIRNLKTGGPSSVAWIPSFPQADPKRSLPAVQQAVLSAWDVPWVSSEKTLFPTDQDRREGHQILEGWGEKVSRKFLPWAIHPGSGSRSKNWPLENFLALAEQLKARGRWRPYFILGPVEEEVSPGMAEPIQALGFPLVRNLPLNLLAGLLELSAGYLGNDSGVTHLAAALNLPTLALFGPTDPELWGPRGENVVILRAEIRGVDDREPAPFAEAETRGWEGLKVAEVLAAIQAMTVQNSQAPRGAHDE